MHVDLRHLRLADFDFFFVYHCPEFVSRNVALPHRGNDSAKSQAADLLGNPITAMYIKSSGGDVKT